MVVFLTPFIAALSFTAHTHTCSNEHGAADVHNDNPNKPMNTHNNNNNNNKATLDIFKSVPSEEDREEEQTRFNRLCHLLMSIPDENSESNVCQKLERDMKDPKFAVELRTDASTGLRGVFVNQRVEENQEVLRIPLMHCFRDDRPPQWLLDQELGEQEKSDSHSNSHADQWSTRLAASLLDVQLRPCNQNEIQKLWLSLLPDPIHLRASLPVHWSDEALASTNCAALQLASDASFFARADAVNRILPLLKHQHADSDTATSHLDIEEEEEIVLGELEIQRALDIVQTRSCRVKQIHGYGPALRLLAPVFDCINHGGTMANAQFTLEENPGDPPALVVFATQQIEVGQELTINYGESAKPEWKCLSSYGFLPTPQELFNAETDEDDSSAEIYINGKRYEINASVIPTDLVYDVADLLRLERQQDSQHLPQDGAEDEDENYPLTAEVALHIAARVNDVACQLNENQESLEGRSPSERYALDVASQLRSRQYDTLVATAAGLREYAMRLID